MPGLRILPRAASLAAALALTGAPLGCGAGREAAPELPPPGGSGPVSYVESGGFALRRLEVQVRPDGRGSVHGGKRRVFFRLPEARARRLFALAAGADVTREAASPPCCDQPSGVLVVDGRPLSPAAAGKLARELREVLRRHAPRP